MTHKKDKQYGTPIMLVAPDGRMHPLPSWKATATWIGRIGERMTGQPMHITDEMLKGWTKLGMTTIPDGPLKGWGWLVCNSDDEQLETLLKEHGLTPAPQSFNHSILQSSNPSTSQSLNLTTLQRDDEGHDGTMMDSTRNQDESEMQDETIMEPRWNHDENEGINTGEWDALSESDKTEFENIFGAD